MIELLKNALVFRFPGVHPKAECRIDFQRTLRIPDDDREYPLPPGLGHFPVEHVDDYAERLPEAWKRHGGVFIPLYQSEALWINFVGDYPCAIKVATGKINAVSGREWTNGLDGNPQDYVVIPDQPWLDGFNVAEGVIRQFVAMPLGEGYTAEEQITGEADFGGIQIIAYPMTAEAYGKYCQAQSDITLRYQDIPRFLRAESPPPPMEMGLAPGGLMRQQIYDDEYGIDAWDQKQGLRCFVHLANSVVYQAITGQNPPHKPPTAKDYTKAGLPWFDYYTDRPAVSGSGILRKLVSVGTKMVQKGVLLPSNEPIQPGVIRRVGPRRIAVRDGQF